MNNQNLKHFNGINATDLDATLAVDVSTGMQTVEPKHYLVTLQQTNGNTHTLQLTEDELATLGLKPFFLTSNDTILQNSAHFKDPLIGQTQSIYNQGKTLKSCENPIEITPQNKRENNIKIISDILLSGQKQENNVGNSEETATENIVYQVVYPEELNLKPILNKPKKCGRPKKKAAVINEEMSEVAEESPIPAKSARTRSGRVIRPPRHIEKDFKKIDISDRTENEEVLKTTEFSTPNQEEMEQPKVFKSLSDIPRKRIISAKYKCPKCQKVYLGRSRMVKHLEDNPDHGPIPEYCKTNNSEVWNCLVDVTQKSPAGKKGLKFCEELSNLLQNLKVLSRFLFKLSDEKNAVALDKYLGAVLDLPPGNYRFNESELHKDVTIFKMLNDMKLFEDAIRTKSNNVEKSNCNVENNLVSACDTPDTEQNNSSGNNSINNNKVVGDSFVNGTNYTSTQNENAMNEYSINEGKDQRYCKPSTIENIPNANSTVSDNVTSLHNELLSDNSLMNSLQHLRCSVDDLILPGMDSTNVSQLLDTTTSSEEAMNVDQFVNERLKTITGPDIDVSNFVPNLDLPNLDLFHFHDS